MDLLCRFGHRFPPFVARLLDREIGKKRKYREETVTDLLMAGLVPFEPLGVMTDFPIDESATGEDMDWEFVNTHPGARRRYLRLHIQAKRAHPYPRGAQPPTDWWYASLDHAVRPKLPAGTPKGSPKPPAMHGLQHKRLVDHAASLGCCVPLFMFYNPGRALPPSSASAPDVEGVNWMFADLIPENVSAAAWPAADKMVSTWRRHYKPLQDLLCFGDWPDFDAFSNTRPEGAAFFVFAGGFGPTPGDVADRLRELRNESEDAPEGRRVVFETSEEIPQRTLALLEAARGGGETGKLPRRRAIFTSNWPDPPRG